MEHPKVQDASLSFLFLFLSISISMFMCRHRIDGVGVSDGLSWVGLDFF